MGKKDETTESIDQPIEDSTTEEVVEQPKEESQDQPVEESVESEEVEPQKEEELVELADGTKVTLEELRLGYMRQSDYTRKLQEVAPLRKKAEATQGGDDLSPEEKEALKALSKLGVARKADVEDTVRTILAQQTLANERLMMQKATGLSDEMMDVAQFTSFKLGIPLQQAVEKYIAPTKSAVKRKVLSPTSNVTTSASGKIGKEITPEYIRNLDPDSKEFEEVVSMMEKGEL